MALCWIGMIGSLLLLVNFWPRAMLVICFVCFLSFISTARDFSEYQRLVTRLRADASARGREQRFRLAHVARRPDRSVEGECLLQLPVGLWAPAFARQLISVAVGVVSHLFRIGNREARER